MGDGSHWRHVIPTLHNAGHKVVAVQNPLTSLADDVDRTRKLAESLDGPTLLVGHSYGGAVITGAGHAANVVGLVYISAFAPDEGDSLGSIFARTDQPAGRPTSPPMRRASCGSHRTSSRRVSARTSTTPRRW
ncbi:alpha/beta hydrolase family protein [Rhodococcus sp. MTM3W5.2]|nr:alpha/beta hydrolase family protein [Rhodococcus sp. MTM3W5.2]